MNEPAHDRLEPFRTFKAEGKPIVVLTAYDYPTARLLEEAGVDSLLVGDSLGMVVLGYRDTVSVTMDEMVHHIRAVARGSRRLNVIGDLPYASYETDADAVANARRLREAGADAVKLEGGREVASRIRAVTGEGIPVVGHIGMLPQHVREEGGYKIKGRTSEEGQRLLDDALALEEAGAIGIVLELVTAAVSGEIRRRLRIPTIGIGSGADCDGQVLVIHDLIGLFPWFTPKFATPVAHVGATIRETAATFAERIRAGTPPLA